MPEKTHKDQNLRLLYQENANFHRDIIEWRHKVMLRFFITTGAFSLAVGWIWQTNDDRLKRWLWVPFLLASFNSVVFYLFDRRNAMVMKMCERVGKKMEETLHKVGGYYTGFSEMLTTRNTYTNILRVLYLSTALMSFIGSVILLLRYYL